MKISEFCNKIRVVSVDDVSYIYQNEVKLKPNKYFDTITTDYFSIEPKPDNNDAGCLWTVDQTIIVDKVSEVLALKYQIPRSVIVLLEKEDNNPVCLGSIDYPVQLILILGIQKDQLSISLKTTDRPIL